MKIIVCLAIVIAAIIAIYKFRVILSALKSISP